MIRLEHIRSMAVMALGGAVIALTSNATVARSEMAVMARPEMPIFDAPRSATANAPRLAPGTPTRTTVSYQSNERPGTIVIDASERTLHLVLEDGKAIRYMVGVGRQGFEWSGTERVSRKVEWPSWHPPAAMRKRQPYLPSFMPGGLNNPLGARAIYLGATLYRIHGTSEEWTIGQAVSSGCIRLLNTDIEDLYGRVPVGSKVVVL